MDLLAKLQQDMKAAMKSGQKERLGVIRMLLNDVNNIDMDPRKPTAEDVVAAYGKKLRKSQEEYQKLGRQAEADQLSAEIAIVDEYLPKRASADETAKLVDAFLASGNYTEKQIGQAMGAFMKQHAGKVDAAAANQLIRQRLAGK